MIELTKICNKCCIDKPFTEYTRDRCSKWGFKSMCTNCRSKRRKELDIQNPEVLIQQRKRTYQNCKERRLLENKINYLKRPHIHIAKARRYELSKINRTPKWLSKSDLDMIKSYYALSKRLTTCLGIEYHVDHIIPLRGKNVSGLHVPSNLQVIPATINMSKRNKWQ